jgi:sugar phosphate isomerase/epimerase
VGAHFNLVHWKWVPQTKSLDVLLAEAMPYLKAVTINGMAGSQIVSLAEGDFDLVAFMAAVKKAGYRGMVGLQGYGIKGPSEEHLKKSMDKWREILAAIVK